MIQINILKNYRRNLSPLTKRTIVVYSIDLFDMYKWETIRIDNNY
jgi:hypothetical protein